VGSPRFTALCSLFCILLLYPSLQILTRVGKAATAHKRKRNSYGLDVKMAIIKRRGNGERVTDTARVLGMPETTIRTVLKNANDYEAKATTMLRHSEVKLI
jgi:hypothetical protein